MKVGVVFGNTKVDVGGGYTFESDLLQALINIAGESRHTFVVLGWMKEPPEGIPTEFVQFISLYRESEPQRQGGPLSIFPKAINRLKRLRNEGGQVSTSTTRGNWLDELLLENKIELLWSLTPGSASFEVPYITTVWDLQHRLQPYFPEVSSGGEWEYRERLYTTALRRATFVITGTEVGRSEIEFFYQVHKERIKVLPLPVPSFASSIPSNRKVDVHAKFNIPENYLLYPAQFWPHKNHIGILLAVRLLREKYSLAVHVVFVGSDKGNRSYVAKAAEELNLSSQVHFLGFVARDELVALYSEAFALLYPSYFGPDNLPPLEAFAIGCPVIAGNIPGAAEQLGDAALLFDMGNTESIAQAVKSLYEDHPLRQTLIRRGKARSLKWNVLDYVRGVFNIIDDFESIRRTWSSDET